eukprot:jgi/Chrzof1/12370/Cz06g32010.t1
MSAAHPDPLVLTEKERLDFFQKSMQQFAVVAVLLATLSYSGVLTPPKTLYLGEDGYLTTAYKQQSNATFIKNVTDALEVRAPSPVNHYIDCWKDTTDPTQPFCHLSGTGLAYVYCHAYGLFLALVVVLLSTFSTGVSSKTTQYTQKRRWFAVYGHADCSWACVSYLM